MAPVNPATIPTLGKTPGSRQSASPRPASRARILPADPMFSGVTSPTASISEGIFTDARTAAVEITEGRVVITPEIAATILENYNYKGQRPLSNHVETLAEEMRRGQFTPGTPINFAVLNDKPILVNGQHRLAAMVSADVDMEFMVILTPCNSMAEVATVYYRHDTVQRKRGIEDIVRAAGIDEKYSVGKKEAVKVISAATFIARGFTTGQRRKDTHNKLITPDAKLDATMGWWKSATAYLATIDAAPDNVRKLLLRTPIMAVGLVTFKFMPEAAQRFWEGVAKDDGLRKGDPRKAFLNEVLASRRTTGWIATIPLAKKTAAAWNAFLGNKQIIQIRTTTTPGVVIDGTPIGRTGRRSYFPDGQRVEELDI